VQAGRKAGAAQGKIEPRINWRSVGAQQQNEIDIQPLQGYGEGCVILTPSCDCLSAVLHGAIKVSRLCAFLYLHFSQFIILSVYCFLFNFLLFREIYCMFSKKNYVIMLDTKQTSHIGLFDKEETSAKLSKLAIH